MNRIVPGEELVAERHVDILGITAGDVAVEDVDVGELGRVRTADIVQLGIGEEQLVGQLVGEAAVEVGCERLDDVVLGIHIVGEGH